MKFRFGDCEYDTVERLLTKNGQPIAAAGKVLNVLELLLQADGALIRREDFYQQIWPDTVVEERNLTVHISTLRRLLNGDGQQYIETVPRTGYRINVRVEKEDPPPGKQNDIPHPDIDGPAGGRGRRRWRIPTLAAAAAVVLFAMVILGSQSLREPSQDAPTAAAGAPIREGGISMAVLPFATPNLTESEAFLGLGIADAVIAQLGGLPKFGIRPTSSVMAFTGHQDPVAAGKKLQVDHVLDGLIQRVDGRYRVSIQLVDIESGEIRWGESFEEPSDRLFALQDAIAEKIVTTLVPQIAASEQTLLRSYRPKSAQAYILHLRARVNLSAAERGPAFKAVEQFQQAVALDPGYAQAYAGLAFAYAFLTHTNISRALQVNDGLVLARDAARRALAINPNEAEAYAVLAWLEFAYEWDWDAADENFRRAVELSPNSPRTLESYGWFLAAMGRHEEAIDMLKRARAANPLQRTTIEYLGFARYLAGDPAAGLATLHEASDLEPQARRPLFRRMLILDHLGKHDEAMAERVRWLELFDSRSLADKILRIQEEQGFRGALEEWIVFLDKFDQWYEMADQWMALGEREKALDALERCVAKRCTPAPFMLQHPPFKPLHDEPRFEALVAKLALPR